MGDFFSVFGEDPQNMPGQGLARTDNYKDDVANQQYASLLRQQLASEQELGPQFAATRLKSMDTTLTGNSDQAGFVKQYMQALRLADPDSAALLDTLTESATGEMALDNQMDPSQLRLVEQSGRSSAAARGMGFGPSDAFAESFAKLGYGDQLRDKRRGNALNLAQLRTAIASRPVDLVTQSYAAAPKSSMQMFDTLNRVYAENQSGNRAQAELETKIGMDQADKWNDGLMMGLGAMCWAAREVFGEEVLSPESRGLSLKWIAFRTWLLTDAPEKLRSWYISNGERWAARLKQNPAAKAVVKRWMERRIQHGSI